jgi:hypothetical protein
VGPRADLDVCEKSHPHRDSIPDCPVRSQSLYRLSYPAHPIYIYIQSGPKNVYTLYSFCSFPGSAAEKHGSARLEFGSNNCPETIQGRLEEKENSVFVSDI